MCGFCGFMGSKIEKAETLKTMMDKITAYILKKNANKNSGKTAKNSHRNNLHFS